MVDVLDKIPLKSDDDEINKGMEAFNGQASVRATLKALKANMQKAQNEVKERMKQFDEEALPEKSDAIKFSEQNIIKQYGMAGPPPDTSQLRPL